MRFLTYLTTTIGGALICFGFHEMVTHQVTWMLHPFVLMGGLTLALGMILDALTS